MKCLASIICKAALAVFIPDNEFILLFIGVIILCAFSYDWGLRKQREYHKAAMEDRIKSLEDAGYDATPRYFPKQKPETAPENKPEQPPTKQKPNLKISRENWGEFQEIVGRFGEHSKTCERCHKAYESAGDYCETGGKIMLELQNRFGVKDAQTT